MKTLILTKKQAKYLLNNIPHGHKITIMLKDAEYILDLPPLKQNENMTGGTQTNNVQPQPRLQNQFQVSQQAANSNNSV
jgi:hypothetical protein